MQNDNGKNISPKKKNFFIRHKVISSVAALILIIGGYIIIKSLTTAPAQTQYVLSAVTKGTIISSVSASGQVSASNQIDLKPKASGTLVYVGVQQGQTVKSGALIAQVDTRSAQQAVQAA